MENRFIGLMADDTPALVIGLLGIMKSGNTFVPINPVFPDDRIHFLINDCHIEVLVTDNANYPRALPIAQNNPVIGCLLCLDFRTGEVTEKHIFKRRKSEPDPVTLKRHTLKPRDSAWQSPCYVIFTSGSTGKPKGVPITHGNLVPLLCWFGDYFRLGADTRVMQNLSYTFDFGVFEILTTIIFGGRMYMLNKREIGDFVYYTEFIAANRINTLHTTPAFFSSIVSTGRKMPTLEILHLGGEHLPGSLVTRTTGLVRENCRIYNGYGPTEATINCAVFLVNRGTISHTNQKESIPIGKPSAHNEIYILNKYQRLQPIGTAGELCVAGGGLAPGYLNRPELTLEKFLNYKIIKSFCRGSRGAVFSKRAPLVAEGRKLYKTGDLARWLRDGNIEFLGRIDHQVKIRGFRVEPGEIESHLLAIAGINEAVIVLKTNENEDKYLCAYYTGQPGYDAAGLRENLLRTLPMYMVPNCFVQVERLPITPNGKVDLRALPEPEPGTLQEYAAPGNEIEQQLAAIWSEVLSVDEAVISIDADFFDLGGQSIMAMKSISMIKEVFNVKIPLREFFQLSTIKRIAVLIGELRRTQEPAAAGVGSLPAQLFKKKKRREKEL